MKENDLRLEEDYYSYDELVETLKRERYLPTQDLNYYHTHKFWMIWRDPDYGSNQAVFDSLSELVERIIDCGGLFCDEVYITEEVSTTKRTESTM